MPVAPFTKQIQPGKMFKRDESPLIWKGREGKSKKRVSSGPRAWVLVHFYCIHIYTREVCCWCVNIQDTRIDCLVVCLLSSAVGQIAFIARNEQ